MCPTAAALNFEALASKQSDLIDGLALSLFVFWILADYSDTTFSFDDLAFVANFLYGRSHFHVVCTVPFFLEYKMFPRKT